MHSGLHLSVMAYATPLDGPFQGLLERRSMAALTASIIVHAAGFALLATGLLVPVIAKVERDYLQTVEFDPPPPPVATMEPPPQVVARERADSQGVDLAHRDERSETDIILPSAEPIPMPLMQPLSVLDLARPLNRPARGENSAGSGTGDRAGGGFGADQGTGRGNNNERKDDRIKPEENSDREKSETAPSPTWGPSMVMGKLHRFYPKEFTDNPVAGVALIECTILRNDRVSDCKLIGATRGFEEAAMAATSVFRLRQYDENGKRVYNKRGRIRLTFDPDKLVR